MLMGHDRLNGMEKTIPEQKRKGFVPGLSVYDDALSQNSAVFGVRGNGMTSRMFCIPVTKRMRRSKPSPKPP